MQRMVATLFVFVLITALASFAQDQAASVTVPLTMQMASQQIPDAPGNSPEDAGRSARCQSRPAPVAEKLKQSNALTRAARTMARAMRRAFPMRAPLLSVNHPTLVGNVTLQPGQYEVRQTDTSTGHYVQFTLLKWEYVPVDGGDMGMVPEPKLVETPVAFLGCAVAPLDKPEHHTKLIAANNRTVLKIRGNKEECIFLIRCAMPSPGWHEAASNDLIASIGTAEKNWTHRPAIAKPRKTSQISEAVIVHFVGLYWITSAGIGAGFARLTGRDPCGQQYCRVTIPHAIKLKATLIPNSTGEDILNPFREPPDFFLRSHL